ncbi:phage/conjugal plasmid C-4 type zinc finger protein, TraR family [Desulfobulbus propionicus DSM 2032]|uniref:Phage/conjugal plasmid C-4 type zinc finger protein, TraR family n=1 Tax=Desulfobulbus propionicus (strain ATCC 33891 / DSM 2032 / VKM B-1956 / 1pr3) TaxID=577650 RepID=A0A7U4DPW2_DESPD|nr:TraR/DksA family transcriptional regulator [Desulfobulbus propionicus]ADW18586.1 phage/conjugal plasmid C-4 type zinc finger protein, TraR family [Desulfobulbus propionicus DSM 2032]
MDEGDLAQQNQELFQRMVLKHHLDTRPQGESALECEDCGEPIPDARRKAAKGCTRCICCQRIQESRGQK